VLGGKAARRRRLLSKPLLSKTSKADQSAAQKKKRKRLGDGVRFEFIQLTVKSIKGKPEHIYANRTNKVIQSKCRWQVCQ